MNRNEWLEACRNNVPGIYYWRIKCEEIRKALKYNENPEATNKHHLFNTPEQIAYNNEHYEMWGFNLDGTFEYGKYIVFVTPEEHHKIHSDSDVTKQRRSESQKLRWKNKPMSDKTRQRLREANLGENNPMYGKHQSEETLKKRIKAISESWSDDKRIAKSIEYTGEGNPFYGKTHSDEAKAKISTASKLMWSNPEIRQKLVQAKLGSKASEESKTARKEMMAVIVSEYHSYKESGGSLSWNEFQKQYHAKLRGKSND